MTEVIIIALLAAGIYLATWKEMAGFYAERAAEISVWTEGFRGSSEADIKAAEKTEPDTDSTEENKTTAD